MTTQSNIVIHDPEGEYWEGALVGAEVAHVLAARGVILMPIYTVPLSRAALGAYSRRAWGAGAPLDSQVPRMHCPMVFYACPPERPGQGRINFVARLVPQADLVARAAEGHKLAGSIRLAANSGQPLAHSAGFSPGGETLVDASTLGKLDKEGGWFVRGWGNLNPPDDGYFSCALYGSIPGMSVAWLAVSQSG